MAAQRTIKITKVAPKWIDRLLAMYEELNKVYEPTDDCGELVKAHIQDMEDRLYLMKAKRQKSYQLIFKMQEAMAFRIMCQMIETDDHFLAVILDKIATKIHSDRENMRRVEAAKKR